MGKKIKSNDLGKSDSFIQRIEFPADKFSAQKIVVWLADMGYTEKFHILDANEKLTAIFGDIDEFGTLTDLDMDVNQGITAFVGEFKFTLKCKSIVQKQEELRLATSIVMEPNVIDTDREIFDEDTIRRAAHRFLVHFRTMNLEHMKAEPEVSVVESFIAPFEMSLGGQKIKTGTWIMTVKVHSDDRWAEIKSGEITGFSIEGFGGPAEELFDEIFQEAA